MGAKPTSKTATRVPIPRKFGRIPVDCAAVLAFPSRNANPRLKARLFQIGKGGCGLYTSERLYIGEECLVWATGGGHKYLGVSGKVVWVQSSYQDEHETLIVGIEFKEPIALDDELLDRMGRKSKSGNR